MLAEVYNKGQLEAHASTNLVMELYEEHVLDSAKLFPNLDSP